jgi:hypothetical protein
MSARSPKAAPGLPPTRRTGKPESPQPPGPLRPSPSNLPGRRNLDCPNYLLCLEFAVERWWEHFNCQACGLQRLKDRQRVEELDMPDAPGWEQVWSEYAHHRA